MSTPQRILVIIVTWNKKDYVIDLLNSLSNLDFPRTQLDITVVDNASSDGTVEALQQLFPDVHLLINAENIGGTGGFNTGLSWAFSQPEGRYDYLWLLDNDVVVHKHALSALLTVLEQNPDAAVAGSTMMQLDYPWRINEMGAFVDLGQGSLMLNRHHEEIPGWREKPLEQLLSSDVDLSTLLLHCQPTMDVDYVAAASLLIRAPAAKKAGLWQDFFIHFDDVEWCLRIADMGYRVLVSPRSLIWHLSAAAKVPSWILYYDNRNVLYLLQKHSNADAVKRTVRRIVIKALYYMLLGKPDLAQLHLMAIADFKQQVTGKKSINLPDKLQPVAEIDAILSDTSCKSILIPFTVNLQATGIQSALVKAMKRRNDLRVFYLYSHPQCALPGAIPIHIPQCKLMRYWKYFRLRNQFDIVFQSDYQPILPLSWIAKQTLFINDEYFCLRRRPYLSDLIKVLPVLLRQYF